MSARNTLKDIKNATLQNIKVYQLQNYAVPKAFRKLRSSRIFAYIVEEKEDGNIIAIYETSIGSGSASIYTYFDTSETHEHQISKEEFNKLRNPNQYPVIFNLYLHLWFGHRPFWIMVHQDNGDTYGFSKWKHGWPWKAMMPKEVNDFPARCINYIKNVQH